MVKSPSPIVPASKVIPASASIPLSRVAASRALPPLPDDASLEELIPPDPDAFEPAWPVDPPEPLTASAPAVPPAGAALPPPPAGETPSSVGGSDEPQPTMSARKQSKWGFFMSFNG